MLFDVQKWRSKTSSCFQEARFNEVDEAPSEFVRGWVSLMHCWSNSEAVWKVRLRIGNGRCAFCQLIGSPTYNPQMIALRMLCDPISLSQPSHCMRGMLSLWLTPVLSKWSCFSLSGSAQSTKPKRFDVAGLMGTTNMENYMEPKTPCHSDVGLQVQSQQSVGQSQVPTLPIVPTVQCPGCFLRSSSDFFTRGGISANGRSATNTT